MKLTDEALIAHLRLQGLTLAQEWVEHVRAFRKFTDDPTRNDITRVWHNAVNGADLDVGFTWSSKDGLVDEESCLDYDVCTLSNGEVYTYDMVPE